ncbi:endonuclease III [Alphaproteobacteria bacterium endosymbiont of Tiliacea citrago]|uniref:endonuclease III domain-containing protein n=1 Tax=Alphaproteobacteria bacterium endosymbiont of Tiliacea citrago TaxID=3077944 RepID=UPI00313EFB53
MNSAIFEILESYNYPLKSALIYKNEFTFLVAIILSAQSRDDFVNTQTPSLFDQHDSPEKILELGNELFEYIKKIGLWRNKGKNILELCKQIIQLKKTLNIKSWYESFYEKNFIEDDLNLFGPIISKEGIPSFRSGLLTLSGVGRKTANVFLNVVYNANVFPVDTHVIRLTNRLGISDNKNPLEIEKKLMDIVPEYYKNKICHFLVYHGRTICKAVKPKCSECKLKEHCFFYKNKDII